MERDTAAAQVADIEARPKAADVVPSPMVVQAALEGLDRALAADVERGRDFLRRHVGRITLTPVNEGPRPHYRASGQFTFDQAKVEQVAGEGFEPSTFGL